MGEEGDKGPKRVGSTSYASTYCISQQVCNGCSFRARERLIAELDHRVPLWYSVCVFMRLSSIIILTKEKNSAVM